MDHTNKTSSDLKAGRIMLQIRRKPNANSAYYALLEGAELRMSQSILLKQNFLIICISIGIIRKGDKDLNEAQINSTDSMDKGKMPNAKKLLKKGESDIFFNKKQFLPA